MCTRETTVANLRRPDRRRHSANRPQLNLAALKIARQTTAHDIRNGALTDKQKEQRAEAIRHAAESKIKALEKQQEQEEQRLKAQAAQATQEMIQAEHELDIKNTQRRRQARRSGFKGYPSFKHRRRHATEFNLEAPLEPDKEPVIPSKEAQLQVEDVA
jgi:hypothetical protein